MLGLSWAEIAVILVVAIVVIGPKDLPMVIRTALRFTKKIKAYATEIKNSVNEVLEENELKETKEKIEKELSYIRDMEGKMQKTYDISDMMPDIKEEIKDKEKSMNEEVLDSKATLITHFIELRQRLIYCLLALLLSFIICYSFAGHIYQFLVSPLAKIYNGEDERKMIFTGLTEAFFTYVKLSFFAGFILSFPFMAYQLYKFLAPGLYKKEKKTLLPFLFGSPALFVIGSLFAYYIVFPLAWKFFLSFEIPGGEGVLPIKLEARVSEYLSLVMHLVVAFGLAFQLPVVLTLLCYGEFVSAKSLSERRRYAIVIVFIIAGVITPPDVLSQVALAIPMLLLYEISIIACKRIEKNRVMQHA